MSDTNTMILVDGSSYLFRAFHALPPLTTADGQPTGAMYGVANMLRRLLADYSPEFAAVVFDASGKTFRDDIYSEYKANRPPMPDDLRVQVEPLLELVEVMGFPILRVPGVEADDVIGTLCTQADALGWKTVVSTSDKDLAQLVNNHTQLVNTMSDTQMDIEGVKTKFGVSPDQIIDYLALIGDTVDNVPGVPKVGPKTAAKWLAAYGDLDGVISNAENIKGKVGEYLRDSLEQLPLSRELVTIKLDVELEVGPKDLKLRQPDVERLAQQLRQYQFSSWLRELESSEDGPVGEPEVEKDYEVILDQKQFEAWLERLQDADLIAMDTETTSLNYASAEIVGLSFAVEPNQAAYVPVAHDYEGAPDQLSRDYVLGALKPLLEDPNKAKLGQHFKYDMNVLANHGIHVQGLKFDSMLESYVINSTATRHDMDSLSSFYLDHSTIHYEDVAGKGAKQLTFNQVELAKAGPYAAEDADITLALHRKLWPRVKGVPALQSVLEDIEMPLVPVLAAMEQRGVLVNADLLKAQSTDMAARMKVLQAEAYEHAGDKFNLASTKQLQKILFEDLGLPVIRKTPKGAPSTAEDVLQELARDYPLPQVIMDYRQLSKLKSTYTDKLPGQINPTTGRVHTSYHQAVAATGRLSSMDPNLQNIPIRTAEGRQIREAFVAPEGMVVLAADYSQIELRIMAHLSDDPNLLAAFKKGVDIHSATAAEVFGLEPDSVGANDRRAAKAINFGLIYGMSAFGLGKQLEIPRGEAQAYIDTYFERYPGVADYMNTTRERARERGHVETVFGRRLYLPEITARNPQRRQGAERAAINAPMQGTAADIIKRAMISVHQWLQDAYGEDARMIMQVHDELVLEVKRELADEVSSGIKEQMAQAAELSVPLVVDVGVGENWHEAH